MKKYNSIYTTGAFDPFHFGHLNILKRAKEMNDFVIVGVSTDELIEKAKGRKPFMPLNQRIAILSELKCVDKVIPQFDKNKQKIVDFKKYCKKENIKVIAWLNTKNLNLFKKILKN